MNLEQPDALDELPQRFPFRFVDHVLAIDPVEGLQASFQPARLDAGFRGLPWVPEACVLESMAQAAVIWFVRHVEPLKPWEIPMIGHLSFVLRRRVAWDEAVRVGVRPVRVLSDRGLFTGWAAGQEGQIAEGRLTVAKSVAGDLAPGGAP